MRFGDIRFNVMHARVELAFIQGKAFEALYSKRAEDTTQDQTQAQLSRIEQMLSIWRDSIPTEILQGIGLSKTGLRMLAHISIRHLECLVKLQTLFFADDYWVDRYKTYLYPSVIEIRDNGPDLELVRSQLSPLPSGWNQCVDLSRRCLRLLGPDRQIDHVAM